MSLSFQVEDSKDLQAIDVVGLTDIKVEDLGHVTMATLDELSPELPARHPPGGAIEMQ